MQIKKEIKKMAREINKERCQAKKMKKMPS
jgi:hypothetical protein